MLHGLAGSRFDAAFFHESGQQLDARIIGLDRPGMGWSSPHPTRTLFDLVKDVGHLTEHLKLESYGVMVRIVTRSFERLLIGSRGYQEVVHQHWLAPKHCHPQSSKSWP